MATVRGVVVRLLKYWIIAVAISLVLAIPGVGRALAEPLPVPSICVSNETDVSVAEIARVVQAVQQQLDLDLQTYWRKTAKLYTTCTGHPDAWKVKIVETDDLVDDAYGYHWNTLDKTPYAVIIMSEIRKHSRPWSVTFSHEVLEMVVDPTPRFNVLIADDGVFVYAVEIGDPVHNRTYRINDVEVSDFVTPAWFTTGAKGPYDFLQYLYEPFVVDEDGGYIPVLGRVDDGGSQPRRLGPD